MDIKKVINKTIIILIIIIWITSGILVGSPLKENIIIIQVIVLAISIIYMVLIKIENKEKILQGKTDIFVFVFCMTPIIPLVFNTYCTLQGTLETIFRYITLFFIYKIVQEETTENKKSISIIIYATITISIVQIIIGIDQMTTKITVPYTNIMGITQIQTEETRLNSVYQYANTFAIICVFSIILSYGKYISVMNKHIKNTLSGVIFILTTGIILSYSRMVFILFVVIYLLYIFLLKSKKNRIQVISITIITSILSIIYSYMFNNWLSIGDFTSIWIGMVSFSIIAIILNIVLDKLNLKIEKVSKKILVILPITIFIIAISIWIIGIQFKTPIILFNEKNSKQEFVKEIYNIEGNKNYNIEILLEAKTKEENNFKITIQEKNKYFDICKETQVIFDNFVGSKRINIQAQEETEQLFILFSSNKVGKENLLKINQLKINNKEEAVNYAYLPLSLVDKINNINVQTKSTWERFVFMKDTLKLVKSNPIFGYGGNAWYYLQGEVEEYNYGVKEPHNYFLEVFLEFGIVGVVALLLIISKTINKLKQTIKEEKIDSNELLSVGCAISILLIHSFFDFDLSFFYVQLILFSFIAIFLRKKEKIETKPTKNVVNIIIVVLLISLFFYQIQSIYIYDLEEKLEKERNVNKQQEIIEKYKNTFAYNSKILYKNIYLYRSNATNEELYNALQDINKWLKHERYCTMEIAYKGSILYENLENKEQEKNKEILENIIEAIYNSKIEKNYDNKIILKRQFYYIEIAKILINYNTDNNMIIEKLRKKEQEEYIIMKENISDYEKCRYPKEKKAEYVKELEENHEIFSTITDL